jgi:hypothetical protein
VRLQPGIFFADDPAFKGSRASWSPGLRLQLQALRRPGQQEPGCGPLAQPGIVGLAELRATARSTTSSPSTTTRRSRACARWTATRCSFRLAEPAPALRRPWPPATCSARWRARWCEFYGDDIAEHPVGTGPFRLAVAAQLADRARTQPRLPRALLRRRAGRRRRRRPGPAGPAAGRRLPMVDRVEISIIEEEQPRWLSFLNGPARRPSSRCRRSSSTSRCRAAAGAPTGQKGIRAGYQTVRSDVASSSSTWTTRWSAAYTPAQVALRRAIGLALDVPREIATSGRGRRSRRSPRSLPQTTGYDPAFKSEMGDHDPARAKALLDLYGWTDRDGDGWRERPTAAPGAGDATQPDNQSRSSTTCGEEPGRRRPAPAYRAAKWPENLKAARGGQYQIWRVGGSAAAPDGLPSLARFHGPQVGRAEHGALQAAGLRCALRPPGSAARRTRAPGPVRLRRAAALVGRAPGRFLAGDVGPLRPAFAHAAQRGAVGRCHARRTLVRRCAAQLRGPGRAPCRQQRAGAGVPQRTAAARRAQRRDRLGRPGRPGGGAGRHAARTGRAARRPRLRLPAQRAAGGGGLPGLRVDRRRSGA